MQGHSTDLGETPHIHTPDVTYGDGQFGSLAAMAHMHLPVVAASD